MTLFICQGDWTTRIPDSWSNVILSVSVTVFLNETKIWIRRWSKSDHLPQCGRASPDPLIAWIEYKAEERTFHPFFLSSLEHEFISCLQTRTWTQIGTYTIASTSQTSGLGAQTWALLGLQLSDCRSWNFSMSRTKWANSLWHISVDISSEP